MNIIKIQNEAIKSYINREVKGKGVGVRYGRFEGKVGITTDEYRLYLIPEKEFVLDVTKFGEPLNIERVVGDDRDYFSAEKGVIRMNADGKTDMQSLTAENATSWVNRKFLGNFDKDAEFKIRRNNRAGVRVYEHGELVGMVMPIAVKEEK